ncbi:MAG: PaaI family thioesterase [Alphaproteobacteria bacterium]|nr:PaaI family thioesterase [Alphaproteobacteria bacterium]
MSSLPEGFAPLRLSMGFLEANGPLFGRWDGAQLHLGFRVEERHCNPGKVCHGGMLALFADMLLPIAARFQAKQDMGFLPTINLTCDYLAPAPLGAWVEGTAAPVRITKNLLFAQGLAMAGEVPVLRANGIFKITSAGSSKAGDVALSNLFGFSAEGRPTA